MQELIKVSTNHKGTSIVSAKELHSFLEVRETYSDWIERMLSYGFIENVDYQAVTVFVPHLNGVGGTNKKDHALTLDCAKEISMIQRSEKGKQARQYFLECERKSKSASIALPSTKELAMMVVKAEEEKEQLQQQIQIDAPKVLFANSVTASEDCVLMRDLAKVITQNGHEIGQNRLFKWMHENHYLIGFGNEPAQRYVEMGLFKVVKRTINPPNKEPRVSPTTMVTGKGQLYFVNKFLNQKQTA